METNRMTIIRNNPQPRLSASVAYGNLLFLSGQTPKAAKTISFYKPVKCWRRSTPCWRAGSDKRHILSAQIWLISNVICRIQ
jgi:enamine deaminase RidA (YjgF/YER057c/UK114 family)